MVKPEPEMSTCLCKWSLVVIDFTALCNSAILSGRTLSKLRATLKKKTLSTCLTYLTTTFLCLTNINQNHDNMKSLQKIRAINARYNFLLQINNLTGRRAKRTISFLRTVIKSLRSHLNSVKGTGLKL